MAKEIQRGKREAAAAPETAARDEKGKNRAKPEKQGWRLDLLDWLQLLTGVLLAVVAVFTLLVSIVGVEGTSMYPTLHPRDLMLVQRIAYTPETGDVIVLRKEGAFSDRALVKRVIATEGQTVLIDYNANTVTVDGVTLSEPYLNYEYSSEYGSDFMAIRFGMLEDYINQAFTVPEGCVFVMGDNRNGSSDSRVAELGMVDEGYILGRVLLVIWPMSDAGAVR